jgi:hypothetical protein
MARSMTRRGIAIADRARQGIGQHTMEGTLLQPLPPFRAKPSRKLLAPKLPTERRKADTDEISIRARRVPVRLTRLKVAPSLKVLSLPGEHA